MTDLFFHNTLSRKKEKFVPLDPTNVRLYVCGPTVYDFAHIGNARPVVVFDTLVRLLRRFYPKVTYVRNITDIDDKIIEASLKSGEAIASITARTTALFQSDMAALNALTPDVQPKCTESVPAMVEMIKTLLVKGYAYEVEGHVLFHVPALTSYGQLSRRSRDELIAGARVDVAPYKKDPADFVLWKPSRDDQPGWLSPFGRGRPGWHIECSAMAKEHLGTTFDIHGGGLDLIFPHHENEIAQSFCANDQAPLATYWMHNGFLTLNSSKMSKSLGNFVTVHELLQHYQGEVLRFALLNAHYRQPLDFSEASLDAAKSTLDRWYNVIRGMEIQKAGEVRVPVEIEKALADDLNTPLALTEIHALIGQFHRVEDRDQKQNLQSNIKAAGQSLGLLLNDPQSWFRDSLGKQSGLSDAEIELKIRERRLAREARDFKKADALRDELLAAGILLEDNAQGTTWRRG